MIATRGFSQNPQRRMMDLTGFSEMQLQVKDSVSKICAKFPDD